MNALERLKVSSKIPIWFPSSFQGHSVVTSKQLGSKRPYVNFRMTLIAICESSRNQWGQWPEWDLLCLIQLPFQSTEHLCSCSCFGPWEMLQSVRLLGDVSLCFIVGRSFMEMLYGVSLLPPQADVLECGITWAAGLHPLWDRLSMLTALNSSRCWLGKKVMLKLFFSCPGGFY